jgi:ring-1,2-phenylacetyl-CoA epoxidase subunit PaaD
VTIAPDETMPTVTGSAANRLSVAQLRDIVGAVADPEIPVLTLHDLGILRDVRITADGTVDVTLTPTYTGCPATAVIAADVETALHTAGVARFKVRTVLSPAWTTDWMSQDGHRKLREYGIAPPGVCQPARSAPSALSAQSAQLSIGLTLSARCPRCGSTRTREISRFGSTPCKSLWSCLACAEPFDSFKAI